MLRCRNANPLISLHFSQSGRRGADPGGVVKIIAQSSCAFRIAALDRFHRPQISAALHGKVRDMIRDAIGAIALLILTYLVFSAPYLMGF